MQQPGIPYVGSKITLISRSGFRYEGTLFSIDSTQGTVALREVTIIGGDGKPLAGSKVYEYIVFKGSDIKDLTVNSAPQPTSPQQPQPNVMFQQPQVQQPQFFGQQQFPTYSQPKPQQTQVVEKKVEVKQEVKKEEKKETVKRDTKETPKKDQPKKETPLKKDVPVKKEEKREEKRPEPQQQDFQRKTHLNTSHRGGRQDGQTRPLHQRKPQEKTKFENDFDFESSNTEFVKGLENDKDDLKKKEEILKNVNHYQKDSFFDAISRESTNSFDREGQKKKDIETFGTAYAHHNFRGRGRGTSRGGRGSRGRGRGNHQEN